VNRRKIRARSSALALSTVVIDSTFVITCDIMQPLGNRRQRNGLASIST
jgi:hypothetical protein